MLSCGSAGGLALVGEALSSGVDLGGRLLG
jgi:hypothetical protein